jgi:hypothetical protein
MAYTPHDNTKPDTSTQSIAQVAQSIRDNEAAIIDGILYGGMKGWDGATIIGTGTAEKPQYWKLDNGSEYIRITPTWDGTYVRPNSLLIEWSDDDTTYHTVGTITITWNGNYYSSHAWS